MDDIAFKFFREFPFPKQIVGMLREPTYLPQWLALRRVPSELHQEAIALITEKANALLATR
jgi:hypothetical protein